MYMADVHKHAENATRSVCPPSPTPSPRRSLLSHAPSPLATRRFREQAQINRTKCARRHVAAPRPRAIV